MEDPEVEQHHRARPRAHLLPGLRRGRARCYFVEKALAELHAGRTKTWTEFKVPDEAIGCGFHEAVRGVLSHHVVIRDGKIANYHPYPPTPWNANPRDIYGTPGPYEDAVQNTPIFEENGPDNFKGIDIMRTVRSFDPCLPCGVHMYLGNGKMIETRHSPMFGVVAVGDERNRREADRERDLEDVQRRLQRVEALVETVQRTADPSVRAATQELVEAILDLHGAGLDRILEIVTGVADNGAAMLDRFSRDELVASLLLLHGLHPVDFETRVRQAVETLGPSLRAQGGAVELLGIEEGVVRVRLSRSGHGCSGSTALQQTIRSAFYEAAPDLQRAGDRRGHRASARRSGSALFAAPALCRSWADRARPRKGSAPWATRTKGRRIPRVRARARRSVEDEGKEPGREDTGTTGADRPAGTRRDATRAPWRRRIRSTRRARTCRRRRSRRSRLGSAMREPTTKAE